MHDKQQMAQHQGQFLSAKPSAIKHTQATAAVGFYPDDSSRAGCQNFLKDPSKASSSVIDPSFYANDSHSALMENSHMRSSLMSPGAAFALYAISPPSSGLVGRPDYMNQTFTARGGAHPRPQQVQQKPRRLDCRLPDEQAKLMPSHLYNKNTMKLTMKRFGVGSF